MTSSLSFSAALYKKSCELYRQNGYNTSGIYRIDIDGNGPLPPSYVKCDFSDLTGETTTIVEHNLPQHYVSLACGCEGRGRWVALLSKEPHDLYFSYLYFRICHFWILMSISLS